MISSRLLACVLGLAALAVALYVYEEYIRLLGFPDGHVTDLGTAEKTLAAVFIGLSTPLGLYLIYLGTAARQEPTKARWLVVVGLYGLVLVGALVVDRYLRSHLDGGAGG